MPELPDVERFRQYLSATGLNKTVETVEVTDNRALADSTRPVDLRKALQAASLSEPRRHGKWLFARIRSDGYLGLHFGMTGFLEHFHGSDAPRHSRMLLWFEDGSCLAYVCQRMLGEIATTDDPDEFLAARGVGPDAMELDAETFAHRISRRRSAMKSAVMNQSVLAGLGNIYADETLFQAGVHPRADARQSGRRRIDHVHKVMRRVLTAAIQRGADARRLPRRWLVHRREPGQPCPRCGRGLEHMRINQRGTYFCPDCQPR